MELQEHSEYEVCNRHITSALAAPSFNKRASDYMGRRHNYNPSRKSEYIKPSLSSEPHWYSSSPVLTDGFLYGGLGFRALAPLENEQPTYHTALCHSNGCTNTACATTELRLFYPSPSKRLSRRQGQHYKQGLRRQEASRGGNRSVAVCPPAPPHLSSETEEPRLRWAALRSERGLSFYLFNTKPYFLKATKC